MHIKYFGCLCYVTSIQAHITKFDYRAIKSMFIGYKEGTKGFIIHDLSNHDVFLLRNFIFYESVFPFKDPVKSQSQQTTNSDMPNHTHILYDIPNAPPNVPQPDALPNIPPNLPQPNDLYMSTNNLEPHTFIQYTTSIVDLSLFPSHIMACPCLVHNYLTVSLTTQDQSNLYL